MSEQVGAEQPLGRPEDVEVIEKRTGYKGYFQVDVYRLRHRTFAGGWATIQREVFERGHAVVVALYDPERDTVVMIEQFRVGAYAAGWNPWLIECVAGIIDEGETPEQVAIRETAEEAGAEPDQIVHVGDYIISAGGSSETVRFFCAKVDSEPMGGLYGLEHEGEDIRVVKYTVDEAYDMVRSGRISNSMAVIAIQWLKLERDELRKKWLKG